jgi:hypothetical protein
MTLPVPATPENLFTYGAPNLQFGPGASAEIGFDRAQYGVHRVVTTCPRPVTEEDLGGIFRRSQQLW